MTRFISLFVVSFLFINLSTACIPYIIQVQDKEGNPLSDVSILILYKANPDNGALQGVIEMMEDDEIYWAEHFTDKEGWKEYLTDEEGFYEDGSPCAGEGNYPHTFVISKEGYETLEIGVTNKIIDFDSKDGKRTIVLTEIPKIEIVSNDFSTLTFAENEWVKVPITAVTQQLTVFSTKEAGKIWLFDANGRLHFQQNLGNQVNLTINNLVAGHYYLRVQSGEKQQTIKILKL